MFAGIINPEATAEIEKFKRCALARYFNEKPASLLRRHADFNNIRHLTAQMAVLQFQAIKVIARAQCIDHIHNLSNTHAEGRTVTAGSRPIAAHLMGKFDTDAQLRAHAQRIGLAQNKLNLARTFQHKKHVKAEALRHQR